MALIINQKYCKGCGICITFCPKNVLSLTELNKVYASSEDKCIFCGQCELRCPDFVFEVTKEPKGAGK